jgi:dTDP-4-amino-4,6-dideoxygalactose transaminase
MTFTVPYIDLPAQASEIREDLLTAVGQFLDSGRYILGPSVEKFEKKVAELLEVKHAVGVGNGTFALILLLSSLDLKDGDEVITVPNSFIATTSSIALAGGRPVFVDINSDMNMNPACIEAAITPKTRCIVPVHLTGRPAKMEEIIQIAKKHDLFVIEDAAQAIGAKLDGKPVGAWGNAAGFSCHPLKNLFCYGDGGVIATNEDKLYSRLVMARNHGMSDRETCSFWSYNSRLDEIHAAMMLVHLEYLERWTKKRRQLAFRYNKALKPYVDVPEEGRGEYCVYQTYMIQAEQCDELQSYLREKGVEALTHYRTPLNLQPAAEYLGYNADSFPVTKEVVAKILSLPLFPTMAEAQQDMVIDLISKFYKK